MLKNNKPGTVKCYTNVTIKKCKNNVVLETYHYHNTVTTQLFKGIGAFLQNLVVSKDSYSSFIPKYLGLGTGTEALTATSTSLEKELPITRIRLTPNTPQLTNDNILSIPFVAVIPYSSISDYKINELGLFANQTVEQSGLLAGFNLTTPIQLTRGSSLTIEWDINLQAGL